MAEGDITGVSATRSGNDIVVSWSYGGLTTGANYWDIRDTPDNGATWTTVASDLNYTPKSWTHSSPSTTVSHTYQVRMTKFGVNYPWSASSNTVQLIAPPAAPTDLAPAIAIAGQSTPFTWTHNSLDTSSQSAFQLKYSTDGTTWTDTGKVTSTVSSWDASTVEVTAGGVQWQVRTWGADASSGPYSAITVTNVTSAPTVTVSTPGASVGASSVAVAWTYAQAESVAQSSWSVTVADDAIPGSVVSSASGTGATASWTTPSVLADSHNYTATVTVASAYGATATDTQSFAVIYDSPFPPTIALADQVTDGYIAVTATTTTSDGTHPAVVSLMLERSIDGGPWATIWSGATTGTTTVRDNGCSLTKPNSYRVTGITATPSQAQTVVTYQSPTLGGSNALVLLATGANLGDITRFVRPQVADYSGAPQATLNQFAGRAYPVATHGQGKTVTIKVSALLLPYDQGGTPRDLLEDDTSVFFTNTPVLYRDSMGRRFYCSLSDLAIPSGFATNIQFTATRVDPGTGIVEAVEQ